ncbi:MAG: ABC transporter permease [Candidatus Schekmanbacteria bacterium]|nr:MAG: ABC transporter permease [Candidatus Schekmanbacteria bacterium]
MKKILPVARKEFIHIIRDFRTLFIAIVNPAFILILFVFALKFDVSNVNYAVFDFDNSQLSRRLIRHFEKSGYFNAHIEARNLKEAEKMLKRGDINMILVIRKNFEREIHRGNAADVALIIDGADNNTANQVRGYANKIIAVFSSKYLAKYIQNNFPFRISTINPISDETRIYYNQSLDSRYFFIPGLIAIILLVGTAMLTSVTLVKEREVGTIEGLMASPLTRNEIVLGKTLPFCAIAMINLFTVMAVSFLLFRMPFRGNFLEFLFICALFILLALSIGIMISAFAKSQQTAWLLSLLGTMLPSFLLSGFVFPIELMPRWLQFITLFVPARYFIPIMRGLFLKGVHLSYFYGEIAILILMMIICFTISTLRFRKVVD